MHIDSAKLLKLYKICARLHRSKVYSHIELLFLRCLLSHRPIGARGPRVEAQEQRVADLLRRRHLRPRPADGELPDPGGPRANAAQAVEGRVGEEVERQGAPVPRLEKLREQADILIFSAIASFVWLAIYLPVLDFALVKKMFQ